MAAKHAPALSAKLYPIAPTEKKSRATIIGYSLCDKSHGLLPASISH